VRILFVAISFLSFSSHSQILGMTKDALLWTGIGVNLDINKQFSFAYENQVRLNQNMTTLQNFYNEFAVGFNPPGVKGLDFGIKYRLSRKNRGEYYAFENRFNLDAQYGYKIEPINVSISFRARYQVAFNRLGTVNTDIFPRTQNTARFRFKISYNNPDFKRVQPFVSAEPFVALQPKNQYSWMNSYRLTGGIKFDLPKRFELEAYYIFEKTFRAVPIKNYIYGLQLTYVFKDPLIKEKKEEGADDAGE
jgi:hypothetical protein